MDGPLWSRIVSQDRFDVISLGAEDIPQGPGIYAWFEDDVPIYVGKATSLRSRIWKNHLARGRGLSGSAFRRNVAEMLGIASSAAIKAGSYELNPGELAQVRGFIDELEIAWIEVETPAAALDLETAVKLEWTPRLTKL